jgi:hypothetical protein
VSAPAGKGAKRAYILLGVVFGSRRCFLGALERSNPSFDSRPTSRSFGTYLATPGLAGVGLATLAQGLMTRASRRHWLLRASKSRGSKPRGSRFRGSKSRDSGAQRRSWAQVSRTQVSRLGHRSRDAGTGISALHFGDPGSTPRGSGTKKTPTRAQIAGRFAQVGSRLRALNIGNCASPARKPTSGQKAGTLPG